MINLRTRSDRRNDALSRKFKKVIILVAISFASLVFLEDVAKDVQRRLRCTAWNPGNTAIVKREGTRSLSSLGKMLADRALGEGGADPCVTYFPDDAQEFFAASVGDPNFDIAAGVDKDLAIIPFGMPDNEVDLSPGTEGDAALDEAERGLMNTYDPIIYEAAVAIAMATTNDQGTVAYVVAHTGCSEWYEPATEAADEPASATDLYEASAVIKSQVCEMTEQATLLGQEMTYTM